MENVFGIDKDIWERVVLPTLALDVTSQRFSSSLVIVRESKDIKDVAMFYENKMGKSWEGTKAYTEMADVRGIAINGREDRYYVTSSDKVDSLLRGARFTQLIFAKG